MKKRQNSDDRNTTESHVERLHPTPLEPPDVKVNITKKTITESEQRLNSIIDGSPIPAFMIGKDHRIIYWNKSMPEKL
jgi:PAS domain-containing protein